MSGDVDQWLEELGLGALAPVFVENEVAFDYLRDLTNEDLKDLGIQALGQRKILLRAIAALSAAARPADGGARAAIPAPAAAGVEAERRQLTVLFCDLVGSTELSGTLDPEDLRDVMARYQDAVAGAVARYEGHVAKFLGDGVLAFFGWPRAHEDQSARAVHAGLAAIHGVASLKLADAIALEARVGIATGQVVIGDLVGATAAEADAVAGETPNLAARLQDVAAPGQVVIGAATRHLIGESFELADLGPRTLKGFPEPVAAWRVIGIGAAESRFEAAHPGARANLVGREPELELLHRAWQQSRTGRGQVVLISGEPGIGKSRLVDALSAEIKAHGYTRITLGCSPYHTNSALYPVIAHLERVVGWQRDDGADVKLAKLERALAESGQPLDETVPLFAALLSLPLAEGRYPPMQLTPQQQKQQTLDAIVAWLLEDAEHRPVLQVWEDLHWADPSTLELLALEIQQAPTAPVLNVLTFRPDFAPPWPQRSDMTPLTLNRLERPAVEALIRQQAGGRSLPAEVVDHIVDKTDGVPLYVEELTKVILEADFLRERDGGYELTGPLSDVAIPATLQDSLMARLDRLPTIREVAQIGAVLGREFAYEMVRAIGSIEESVLRAGLEQLVDAELLYQRGRPPRARYIFKHALVQDAAYQSLLKRTRQYYHNQVADLLESRFPAIVETEPELLAHHLTEAGLTERAIGQWHVAGKRAADRSANTEAVGHLTRALDLVDSLAAGPSRGEMELDLRVDMVNPIIAAKGYSSSELKRTFRRALALCREIGTTPRIFPLLYAQWGYHMTTGQLKRSVAFGEEFLRLATDQQAEDLRLIGHRLFGAALYFNGDLRQAEIELERALALYDAERHRALALSYGQDTRVVVLVLLGCVTWCLGHPDRARELTNRALAEALALNHANTEGYAMAFRLLLLALRRDFEMLRQSTDALSDFTTEHRLPTWEALAMMFIGYLHTQQGRHEQGLATFEQAQAFYDTFNLKLMLPIDLAWQAEALAALGRRDRALTTVEQAIAIAADGGERWSESEAYRIKGEILGQSGDRHEAEACFLTAIDVAVSQAAKSFELRAATSLARLWRDHGKSAEARALLAPVYGWFTEGFDTSDLKDAKALLEALS